MRLFPCYNHRLQLLNQSYIDDMNYFILFKVKAYASNYIMQLSNQFVAQ